ncbi:uncharacterized protein LOC128222017 [Mya arenaria]|uniref:uncharacterized protein LOC128222017 n=1 Tax=Mya arenaria TaxID=6604 RepID=UPI0022E6A416|nr:uncharacterized protein LOC128222017 [Mya arenaria]
MTTYGVLVVLSVLILLLNVEELVADCPNNKERCDWISWKSWSSCSLTCGGGSKTRSRELCCKTSLTYSECIDECNLVSHSSESTTCNSYCYNGASYIGGWCRCPAGYKGTCCQSDVNECTEYSYCSQLCTNTHGSYRCSCRQGYLLNYDNRSCRDTDECTDGSSRCSHICSNTVGSYSCSCRVGYTLSWDGITCIDADECQTGEDDCEYKCENTIGSFQCLCDKGNQLNADGKQCSDIDECITLNGGCDQICTNIAGSFYCSCNAGYSLQIDGTSCVDVDECTEQLSRCAQICINDVGGYTCHCFEGYYLAEDEYSCIDIDDCLNVTCHNDGLCIDGVNTYMCSCSDGFTGVHCEEDINECNSYLNGGCEDVCINTIGSFYCNCSGQSTLRTDGFTCSGLSDEDPDLFQRYNISNKVLPRGCSVVPLTHCGETNSMQIVLSSTSPWHENDQLDIVFTRGISFAETSSQSFPISFAGVQYRTTTNSIKMDTEVGRWNIIDGHQKGKNKSENCLSFETTFKDLRSILMSGAFTRSIFGSFEKVLPRWLSFENNGPPMMRISDVKARLLTGEEINNGICRGAPLTKENIYILYSFSKQFELNLFGQNIILPNPLRGKKHCIILDVCNSYGISFFLMLPEESRDILNTIDVFSSLRKHYGISIKPIGFGLSLENNINLEKQKSSVKYWNGQIIFSHSLYKYGGFWIAGDMAMTYGSIRMKGQAFVYTSVPSFHKFLHSFHFFEWRVGWHFTAASDIEIKMSDYVIKLTDEGTTEVDMYGFFGGNTKRQLCGNIANPEGLFITMVIDVNPFKHIPFLNWIRPSLHTRLDGYVIRQRSDFQNRNVHGFVQTVKNFQQHVDKIVMDVKNISLHYYSILSKESLKHMSDIQRVGKNLISTIEKVQYGDESLVKIVECADNLSDDWFSLHDKCLRLSASVAENVRFMKYNLTSNIQSEMNKAMVVYKDIQNKAFSDVNTTNDDYSFGLKFKADSLIFFGIKLIGVEVKTTYTSPKTQHCNALGNTFSLLKNEDTLFFSVYIGPEAVIPLGRTLKLDSNLSAGYGVALSVTNPDQFEVLLNVKAEILGITGRVDMFISPVGIRYYLEGNIGNIFKAQLNVSLAKEISLYNNLNWLTISFHVNGRFVADAYGDGDFNDDYIESLQIATQHLADEASKRIERAKDSITQAQAGLTWAQNWLEKKTKNKRSAEDYFDIATRKMEIAKRDHEKAKIPFLRAKQSLTDAQRRVDRLCIIEPCRHICVPGVRCIIFKIQILFFVFSFPSCRLNSCLFSIPDPQCVISNSGCRIVRTLAYAALEETKGFVRTSLFSLDLANEAVSVAQVNVDKSRIVLDADEGMVNIAQKGLEGAKDIYEGAKQALDGVKYVVRFGVMAINFILKHGIMKIVDVRKCGFDLEVATSKLSIFDVLCDINAFDLGFRQLRIRINFNDIYQSMWYAAKETINSILESIETIGKRERRKIRDVATTAVYTIIRELDNTDLNETSFDINTNETIDVVFRTLGFRSNLSNDYENRKEIFETKCNIFNSSHTFLTYSISVLLSMVNETVNSMNNISSTHDILNGVRLENLTENFTVENIGVNLDVAMAEFNISAQDVFDKINASKSELTDDPLLSAIDSFANEASVVLKDQVNAMNNIMVVTSWIAAMNNISEGFFEKDRCVSFMDCAHYTVSEMYNLHVACNMTHTGQSLQMISEFEDVFLHLTGNASHTTDDVYSMAMTAIGILEEINSLNVFCSQAPEVVQYLQNQTISEGSALFLVCNVTGDPFPTIWWFKDDEYLSVQREQTLAIYNASVEDSGKYYCIAGNLVANLTLPEVDVAIAEVAPKEDSDENWTKMTVIVTVTTVVIVLLCGIISGMIWKSRKRQTES